MSKKNLNEWRRHQTPVQGGEVLYKSKKIKIIGKERPKPEAYPLAAINAGALLEKIKIEAAEWEEKYISTRQKKEIKAALSTISLQLAGIHKQLNRVMVRPKIAWYSRFLFWRNK